MYTQIENAINELNTNIDNLISQGNTVPFSKNLETYETKSDFEDYIRTGNLKMQHKSLNMSVDNEGGYLLAGKTLLKIDQEMNFLSPMRMISKVTNISTNALDVLVDSKIPEAGWVSEIEKRAETSAPEFVKIKIPVHEIYAKPLANQQLLDDSKVNIEKWLIEKISNKFAEIEDVAFISGDGVNKPKGFLAYENGNEEKFGSIQRFLTGAQGAFIDDKEAIDLLLKVSCSIKPKYVKNAKWIMPRSALEAIRKLKNKGGVSIWQPSLQSASPSTLFGYPVIIDDNMPQLKEGTASISIAFGDFESGYQIVDRQNISVMRDPFSMKPFVEFYITKRVGGGVINFDAIKLLKFSDSD